MRFIFYVVMTTCVWEACLCTKALAQTESELHPESLNRTQSTADRRLTYDSRRVYAPSTPLEGVVPYHCETWDEVRQGEGLRYYYYRISNPNDFEVQIDFNPNKSGTFVYRIIPDRTSQVGVVAFQYEPLSGNQEPRELFARYNLPPVPTVRTYLKPRHPNRFNLQPHAYFTVELHSPDVAPLSKERLPDGRIRYPQEDWRLYYQPVNGLPHITRRHSSLMAASGGVPTQPAGNGISFLLHGPARKQRLAAGGESNAPSDGAKQMRIESGSYGVRTTTEGSQLEISFAESDSQNGYFLHIRIARYHGAGTYELLTASQNGNVAVFGRGFSENYESGPGSRLVVTQEIAGVIHGRFEFRGQRRQGDETFYTEIREGELIVKRRERRR